VSSSSTVVACRLLLTLNNWLILGVLLMGSMRDGEPLVSVVIPSYNAGEYLGEAIDSVLRQTYSKIELIVLDDGSTDETRKLLSAYPESSFFWESHKNIGQAATMNKGWAMAKGEILSYLSADDVLLPEAVTSSVEALFRHESAIMTYCDYMLMDEKSEDIRRVYTPKFNYKKMVAEIEVQPGPGVFFRKIGFEKIGGWNPGLRQVPDLEYWLRLGLLGDFFHIPDVLAKFRIHEASQTFAESSIEKTEECVRVIHDYFALADLPADIKLLENSSKSHAHFYAARLHLRAGRYRGLYKNFWAAYKIDHTSIFSLRMVKLLGNGLLFRLKRIFSKALGG